MGCHRTEPRRDLGNLAGSEALNRMSVRRSMAQHWVPESYLRAWCDPDTPVGQDAYVWRFGVEPGPGKPKAPRKVFREAHFYTLPERANRDPLRIEKGLAHIEGKFKLVRDRIQARKPLTPVHRAWLAVFAGAMFARSKRQREHQRTQWGGVLEVGEDLARSMRTATPEQRRVAASLGSSSRRDRSMTLGQVRELVESPQLIVPAMMAAVTENLALMECVVLCTDVEPGFITSDAPCVLADPGSQHRRFPYNIPRLASRTVEVTLPITPWRVVRWNWSEGRDGTYSYADATGYLVDELNQRTFQYCEEHFIARRNIGP
ncbi:MAG: DUF4238 domain-containing protein [Gammaproteobacteria bacterium]